MHIPLLANNPALKVAALVVGLISTPIAQAEDEHGSKLSFTAEAFAAGCSPEVLQAVANEAALPITIREVPNMSSGIELPGGARYFPVTESLPAYCQVSGEFVTEPESGKTAHFLATLPQSWNGKYLQYGCFGHCGFFALNDATSPLVTIIAQGKPGDSLRKGYASFGTDEGHIGPERGAWAVEGPGEVNEEAVEDFLYRATQVLAQSAKPFTAAFYSHLSEEPQTVAHSYFTGCSGGGRDALVAASYFPEEFDGIIVGSPYANIVGVNLHESGAALAALRTENTDIPPKLMNLVDPIVKAECDKLDGVEDGLIQNPAACDFIPERDLPICQGLVPGEECFTTAQIKTLSTLLTAATDDKGDVIQPGMSISELQFDVSTESSPLDNETLRVLAFENDPDFSLQSLIRLDEGGPGPIDSYRTIVDPSDVRQATEALRKGIGAFPEQADELIAQDRKMLIWHNLSDQSLTPFMSYNYYTQLAARHGGYERLQENVRLFTLPGTIHCSMGGVGPTSFDPLSAMENWVEKGKAPNALIASKYPDTEQGGKDFGQPPSRTMPLCKFPEMAKYKGEGDVNDADNWYCPEEDARMLEVGESGKRAGVTH